MNTRPARLRVVVDNDFAGDPDGLVSLAHLALASAVEVVLVTTTPVDPALAALAGADAAHTAARGRELAAELFAVAGLPAPALVAGGEPGHAGENAAAAIAGVESDGLPLVILCGGPLTNVAAALRRRPALADEAALVWIGGTRAGGGAEYNLDTDPDAAATVLASGIPVSRVPRETYERLRVSLAEIEGDLAVTGDLGHWLADRLLDVPPFVALHGALTLGDSALASVAALQPEYLADGDRPDVLVDDLDTRLTWGDLLALLRTSAPQRRPEPPDPKGTS